MNPLPVGGLLGFLQRLASRVHLGRTVRETRRGDMGVCKTRSSHASLLVQAANVYTSIAHGTVRALSTGEWIEWEKESWRALYGIEIEGSARGIFVPWIPAPSLWRVLADQSLDEASKMRAVTAACVALRQLHGVDVCWPDGVLRPWSHSDASVGNVLWDRASNRAAWIDFETRHSAGMPAKRRAADDFLRLGYSVVAVLGASSSSAVAAAMLSGYDDPALREAVVQTIRDPERRLWRVRLWQPILPAARRELDLALCGSAAPESGEAT